jgi:2-keto-3-deoxy-L-rhamnonate aldolase RhmA
MVSRIKKYAALGCHPAPHRVDALFIGTSDLSFSLGLRGRQDEPALASAVARIARAALRHGKFLSRPVANPEQVRRFMEQGFLLFQLPPKSA